MLMTGRERSSPRPFSPPLPGAGRTPGAWRTEPVVGGIDRGSGVGGALGGGGGENLARGTGFTSPLPPPR